MKSTIILLAALAGIGIGATQASANDAQNLSCITEVSASGTTIRDCEPQPIIKVVYEKAEPSSSAAPRHLPEPGGRAGERHGGGQNGGPNGGPNGGQGGGQGGGQPGGPNN